MTNPETSKGNVEQLDEARLVELLRSPGACLRVVEGSLGGSAWGNDITVLGHPIPVRDLLFAETIAPHLEQADEAPKGQLKLRMQQDWRWGFDPGDPSFRISRRGQGEVLTETGEQIPARLACASFETTGGGSVDFHFVTFD
jgi:hypothetical protein